MSAPLTAIGALADPLRLRLYRFIVARREAVSREEAAEALGIPITKAKFHLDRLAEEGVLEVEYRRLSGRSGPGAGRPAKLYRRAASELRVSLPERRYDLMGRILATAIERARAGENLEEGLAVAARETGIAEAENLREERSEEDPRTNDAPDRAGDPLERADAALTALGYEADPAGEELQLHNCPFDALVREHRDLACGANRYFVQGVLDGSGCPGLAAELDPCPGQCCVVVRRVED